MKKRLNNIIFNRKPYSVVLSLNCLMVGICILLSSCEKLVEVDFPRNSLGSAFVFSDEAGANSAIAGMYSVGLGNGNVPSFASFSLLTGLSGDELDFNGVTWDAYKNNSLLSNDAVVGSTWTGCYSAIYNANAIISGLNASTLSTSFKNQMTGEALFIRSLANFYLVNMYGDVPLITNIVVQENQSAPRTEATTVYAKIITDLEQAISILPTAYISGTNRVRANKWAAAALLARVYLYTGDFAKAEAMASQVIGASNLYSLPTDLNSVFLKNSGETIFAYDTNTGYTVVGTMAIPPTASAVPSFVLRPDMFSAFEANDKRKANWTATSVGYSYPFKYKARGNTTANENEVVLRLAEQYLIRAEARAQQNKISEAEADINVIRRRAGINPISLASQDQAINAVAQERRVEFFAEWGHRWMDLKRTNKVNEVVGKIKGSFWQPSDALYPIPNAERINNVKLTQNPGYE